LDINDDTDYVHGLAECFNPEGIGPQLSVLQRPLVIARCTDLAYEMKRNLQCQKSSNIGKALTLTLY
jgi:hypothetical protein